MLKVVKIIVNKLSSFFDISVYLARVVRPNTISLIKSQGHYNMYVYFMNRSLIWSIPRDNYYEDHI